MAGSMVENLQCNMLSQISNVKSYHKGLTSWGGVSLHGGWVSPHGYPRVKSEKGVSGHATPAFRTQYGVLKM